MTSMGASDLFPRKLTLRYEAAHGRSAAARGRFITLSLLLPVFQLCGRPTFPREQLLCAHQAKPS